jgi:inward rectifier potassium channel
MADLQQLSKQDENRDLGFGSLLSERQGLRLLNSDGSFNVERRPRSWFDRIFEYQSLVALSWPRFFVLVLIAYFGFNLVFAGLFMLCGPGAIRGEEQLPPFIRAFFFSVDSFATIGYGNIVPVTRTANFLVAIEALAGLLSFALVTGLLFARFSRPRMDILYSRRAVVAPYRGITAIMIRVINLRDSQIIDLGARLVLSRFEPKDGKRQRIYYQLDLERESVAFFPMAWTIVHPINESSPLWGWSPQQLADAQAEFLVLLKGTDETFFETVNSRRSYTWNEIIWGARFAPIFVDDGIHIPRIDWERFHDVVKA